MDVSRSVEGKFWVTFTRLQPATILFPPSLRGWHFSEVSHLQPGKEGRDILGDSEQKTGATRMPGFLCDSAPPSGPEEPAVRFFPHQRRNFSSRFSHCVTFMQLNMHPNQQNDQLKTYLASMWRAEPELRD